MKKSEDHEQYLRWLWRIKLKRNAHDEKWRGRIVVKMMKSEIEEDWTEWTVAKIMKKTKGDYEVCRWRLIQMMKSETENENSSQNYDVIEWRWKNRRWWREMKMMKSKNEEVCR